MTILNTQLNKNALIKLNELGTITQSWVGNKVRSYIEGVTNSSGKSVAKLFPQLIEIQDKAYSRDEIFNFVNQKRYDDLICCYLIFAWGGMHRSHASSLLLNSKPYIEVVELIRNNDIGCDDAYHQFYVLQNASITRGLGPAFYTKLLYFFGKQNGWSSFIMDQWTSLSINYLFSDNLIKMNKIKNKNGINFYVSKNNDYKVYQNFNNRILFLANELSSAQQHKSFSPEETEIMIFSEGRGKGAWRNFLLSQLKLKGLT